MDKYTAYVVIVYVVTFALLELLVLLIGEGERVLLVAVGGLLRRERLAQLAAARLDAGDGVARRVGPACRLVSDLDRVH